MTGFPSHGLLATSLCLSLIIALFLPLRPLLRTAIGSQWLCALWLALPVRLLLPWPLDTRWGLMDAWHSSSAPAALDTGSLKIKISFPPAATSKAGKPPLAAASTAAADSSVVPARQDIPLLIWLCGFAAALALLAWQRYQTGRLAAQTFPATDERLLAIFAAIPARWRGRVQLRISAAVHVPTLAGISRPQIWKPQPWLAQFSDEELRSILLHELGHVRRGDLAAQWLFAIAQCLHWFNPFVWLAARAARLDREMACDAWVLSRDDSSPAYGATLLKTARMLRTPFHAPSATVAMASGRRNLSARIAGIGAFRPARTLPGLLGAVLMIVALAIVTTSRTTIGQTPVAATVPTAPSQSSPSPATQASASPAASPAIRGPEIMIEAKFLYMESDTWIKMRAENPDFREATATLGDFSNDLDAYAAPNGGAPPDAATRAALHAYGTDKWVYKDGAWDWPGVVRGVSVLGEKPFQKMLRFLDQCKGVDLLAAPRITAFANQATEMEIVREFRYPSEWDPDKHAPSGWSPTKFVTQNVGVSLGATCNYETSGSLANTISLDLNPEITNFIGFLLQKNGPKIEANPVRGLGGNWRPMFSISQGKTQLNVLPDQTVVLGGLVLGGVRLDRKSEHPDFTQPPKGSGSDTVIRSIMLVFVTPSIVSPQGLPPAAGASPTPIPYGIAMPGKPGFVTSPYGRGGYIDARGFSKDARIKDPYTGRIFLVP